MKWKYLCFCLLAPLVVYSNGVDWSPFIWAKSKLGDRVIEKAAIRIPVTLDSLPQRFTMQLDLGLPVTALSGNAIEPYLEEYPGLRHKLDTNRYVLAHGRPYPLFHGINLTLGNQLFQDREIAYYKGYGRTMDKDSIFLKTEVRVGTLGSDLFQNKVLIIDYKNARFAVTDHVPEEFRNLQFEKFEYDQGRVILCLSIDGSPERVLFDTGASYFALSTTREKALPVADPLRIDSMQIPSWGKYLDMKGFRINKPIRFGTKVLQEEIVYYDDSKTLDSFFQTRNLWGITGNKYFLESTVVIDFKNLLFGVKWEE